MAKKSSIKVPDAKSLARKWGASSKPQEEEENQLWIPFDDITLNYKLGGGAPYGRVIEIIGYQSTGKTLMAMALARNTIKLGGIVLWGDHEGTWTRSWAIKNGVDPNKVVVYQDNDVEGFSDWFHDMGLYWRSQLTNNEPILVVSDSLAALETTANIEAEQKDGKAQMGNKAKALDQMYRKRVRFLGKYGVTFVAINQVREKIGASLYEDATTTPGGKATQFYATIRIMLVRSKAIKKKVHGKERKVGQNIIVRIDKNKIHPPAESYKTDVYYTDSAGDTIGYAKYRGLPDVLEESGTVTRKGSRYYQGDKMVGNGEEAFTRLIEKEKGLRSNLLSELGVNTISKSRKQLEEINTNLFPVAAAKDEDEDE